MAKERRKINYEKLQRVEEQRRAEGRPMLWGAKRMDMVGSDKKDPSKPYRALIFNAIKLGKIKVKGVAKAKATKVVKAKKHGKVGRPKGSKNATPKVKTSKGKTVVSTNQVKVLAVIRDETGEHVEIQVPQNKVLVTTSEFYDKFAQIVKEIEAETTAEALATKNEEMQTPAAFIPGEPLKDMVTSDQEAA